MFTDSFFRDLVGDIHDLSIIKCKSGTGILSDGETKCDVDWGLSMEISGNKILILKSDRLFSFKDFVENRNFNKYTLTGTTDCGNWDISSNNVYIISQKFKYDAQDASTQTVLRCSFDRMIFRRSGLKENKNFDYVRAYISNFYFRGSDLSNYHGKLVRDKIMIELKNRTIEFKLIGEYKKVLRLIDLKRIRTAIISTMSFSLTSRDRIGNVLHEIDEISLFLSSLTLNLNYAHMYEFYTQNDLAIMIIDNKVQSLFHKNHLIDNHLMQHGVKNAFLYGFSNFQSMLVPLGLKRFIGFLSSLYDQQHLGFAISSIGTIPRTSKRSGYTHSLTCNLSSSSSQVTILCGNPTVKCFSS